MSAVRARLGFGRATLARVRTRAGSQALRWWSVVALVIAAAAQFLDVFALDRAREGSVRAVFLVAVVVVAGAAAFRADRRVVTIGLATYVGTKACYLAVSPDHAVRLLLIELPVALGLVGAAGLLGNTIRRRQAAEARVEEMAAQARLARARERSLLARELHDAVAHELTIIAMQATLMRMTSDPDDIDASRGVIEETSRRALDELKRLLQVLRTADTPPETTAAPHACLDAVVDSVAAQLRALGHQVSATAAAGVLPRSVELAADRVLREAATNVVKHAPQGSRVTIEVTDDAEALSLVVTNSCHGRQPHGAISSTHLGLSGLEERLSLLGGAFSAGLEGNRWVLRSRIPHRPASAPTSPHGRRRAQAR